MPSRPLADHFGPKSADPGEIKAFIAAVMNNDLAAVQKTLETHPEAAAWRERAGNTPLMMAVIAPARDEIIDLLLNNGADVNAQNAHGGNALARAACFGHFALAQKLLGLGADAAMRDAAGQDAADWAEKGGHEKIAALLRHAQKPAPKPPTPPTAGP
jgi:ankyrin repeat protein